MKCQNPTSNLLQFKINLFFFMCVVFFSSFVCISVCAKVYLKTSITKPNIKIILIAGVPSSQALPGYIITAPPSVCVPDVLGALPVWIQNPKKKTILDICIYIYKYTFFYIYIYIFRARAYSEFSKKVGFSRLNPRAYRIKPSAGRQRFTRGDHFDLLEKRIFLFSIFLFFYFSIFSI